MDLESNPALKTAALKIVESTKGTAQFVELVRDFKLQGQENALLDYAILNSTNSTGVDAIRLVLAGGQAKLIVGALATSNAIPVISALAATGEKQLVPLLSPLLFETQQGLPVRKEAVRALASVQEGASALLQLGRDDKLPLDLRFLAAAELHQARWPNVKKEAAEVFPLPPTASAEPLPPLRELLQRKGDSGRGRELFERSTVGCNKCHQVNEQGVDFGPKLSEIGTKLGKDALYESILDPSAGISFGFEAWQVELKNGDEAFGLITSETAEELSIKAQTGIVARIKKNDIAKREQMKTSVMPSGLQQAMSAGDLVDLVEYLASLKKSP